MSLEGFGVKMCKESMYASTGNFGKYEAPDDNRQ